MDASDIKSIRLNNHQLIGTEFKTPQEIVAWLGAVQAQDFNMGKWAIGARLSGVIDRMVEDALDRGDIIRTHILRPTWHLVSSEDIYWMLALTAPRIKSALKSADKVLELAPDILKKSYLILEKELQNRNHLTRQELGRVMTVNGINCDDNRRLNHIMLNAELDRLVCNGNIRGKQQTYTLLEVKVPKKVILSKEESLAMLARKYFQSHSPATLQDFTWWSGLSVAESRLAIELIRENLLSEMVDQQIYWCYDSEITNSRIDNSVHFLPAFDEYFVSYKNRQHIVADEHYAKVANNFGTFKPMILKDGHIIGKWTRVVKKGKVVSEPELFIKQSKRTLKQIDEEAARYELFNLVAEL